MCTIAPVKYTPFIGYYVIDENYLPENAVKGTISGYLTLNPCSPPALTAVLDKPLITNITPPTSHLSSLPQGLTQEVNWAKPISAKCSSPKAMDTQTIHEGHWGLWWANQNEGITLTSTVTWVNHSSLLCQGVCVTFCYSQLNTHKILCSAYVISLTITCKLIRK